MPGSADPTNMVFGHVDKHRLQPLAENAILMGCASDEDTGQTKQRSPCGFRRTEPNRPSW